MSILAVIPARWDSKRFPGKVLAEINGKTLLQWVYEGASRVKVFDEILIATDDERIHRTAKGFSAEVVWTSADCRSGSDRSAEAARNRNHDLVFNIQADYPDVHPDDLTELAQRMLQEPGIPMGTLAQSFSAAEDLRNPNHVKVLTDAKGDARRFFREAPETDLASQCLEHIGVYAFQKKILLDFARWDTSLNEAKEKLEQLRVMDHGITIRVLRAQKQCHGINHPEDISKFIKSL
jgi:3-deoxy-manno-octulosonate cytidylyltransferase (CMP-KDO synthetase)